MPNQPRKNSSGTRLAIVLVVGGIILSLLATKYRIFMPPTPPTTQPEESRK